MPFMTAADRQQAVKEIIKRVASDYGIEVVGFLRLDRTVVIPPEEMELLKGVKWSEGEVDLSNIRDPAQIMPGARTLIIFGKRLTDDQNDRYYRFSEKYTASIEAMLLDIAAEKAIRAIKICGGQGMEYTSYYLKALAVMAGMGWIGKSRMFVSKTHGPRLRLKGILTDADLGEPHRIIGDDACGDCTECQDACPVGAITEDGVDRKKCGACPQNHRQVGDHIFSYCTACTASCPVGKK